MTPPDLTRVGNQCFDDLTLYLDSQLSQDYFGYHSGLLFHFLRGLMYTLFYG